MWIANETKKDAKRKIKIDSNWLKRFDKIRLKKISVLPKLTVALGIGNAPM